MTMPFVFVAWLMVPVTGLRSLLATAMGVTGSTCQERWLHLSMPSPHDLQHVLDQPVCIMLCLSLTHSSCVVHVCTFLCGILWPEVQSHSDGSPVHAPGPSSACALAQARPTMSCIHLVLLTYLWEWCMSGLFFHLKNKVLSTCLALTCILYTVFRWSNAAFIIIVATLELSLHPLEVLSEIDVDLE